MRILMTGATGFIGPSLSAHLRQAGHEVAPLLRHPTPDGDRLWHPEKKELDATILENFDAVIHLAGESIVGRWTKKKKARLYTSRVDATRLLAAALVNLKNPPKVFLCASAIGIYGDRGKQTLVEESPPGEGFLANLCRNWEEASQIAKRRDIRVANMRFGMVLGRSGGALKKMLPAFRMGVGGILGDGKQIMSWIVLEDLVRVVEHLLHAEKVSGPVNVVAPNPVTNEVFTQSLGKILQRATPFPMPVPMIKILFGEMGEALFLASANVVPTKLQESGFAFTKPYLEDALRQQLA